MIFELVVGGFLSALGWVWEHAGSVLPSPPGWLEDGFAFVADVRGWLYMFDYWLPMTALLGAVGFVVYCWLASMVLNVFRVVASYLTLGGGAT